MTTLSLSPIGRSRLILVALASVFILPLALAWLLYYSAIWQPSTHTHHGVLINPAHPLQLSQFSLQTLSDATPFPLSQLQGRWTLLTLAPAECNQYCWENLYKMRQVKMLLNKDQQRLQKVLLVANPSELKRLEQLQSAYPETWILTGEQLPAFVAQLGMAMEYVIYLIDPLGNYLMYYPSNAEPEFLLKDLKHLLKLSHIG